LKKKPNRRTRAEFEALMKDYKNGKKNIQPGHPEEIELAIKTFLDFATILMDYPEIDHIPSEIITDLLQTLSKYPQYNNLTLSLLDILKQHE